MIQEFVKAWEANKDKLREYIATHNQEEYDNYAKIVKMLFEIVINPYRVENDLYKYDTEKIHEIDDGGCCGSLLYVVPVETCEPSHWDYIVTYVDYGSCSGCDTLLGISHYDEDLPSEEQVKEYMTLCLHIIQHFTYPFGEDEGTTES